MAHGPLVFEMSEDCPERYMYVSSNFLHLVLINMLITTCLFLFCNLEEKVK